MTNVQRPAITAVLKAPDAAAIERQITAWNPPTADYEPTLVTKEIRTLAAHLAGNLFSGNANAIIVDGPTLAAICAAATRASSRSERHAYGCGWQSNYECTCGVDAARKMAEQLAEMGYAEEAKG